ncbi:MAG: hypothetical protein NC041_00270 [Bacteroides sp.]|nr:hypothetical protein [Prevotella sp.]MCM1408622.1 hypothetical protein [Treponema brennaborense]MCM1468890.1 hypothetical protein [Bacteroides sp.]
MTAVKSAPSIFSYAVCAVCAAFVFFGFSACEQDAEGGGINTPVETPSDNKPTDSPDETDNQPTPTVSGTIKKTDTPEGFSQIDTSKMTKTVAVSNKTDFVKYAKTGGYVIYVNGAIDLSEGMLPSSAGGTSSALDAFVKKNASTYSTYEDFKSAYAKGCSASTDDKSSSSPTSSLGGTLWALNQAYGNIIKVAVASNTIIIGADGNAALKGGSLQISKVQNVVIRNLKITDGYDPFPHHEENDGFNAQWDNISVTESSNVWIDHCTFADTMHYSEVTISGETEEKWQTYDGLCDITKSSKNVVVSYCVFENHDKTMLIGSGSSDTGGGNISIHHNYFLNCGQRLPMTCYPAMHIYNNYYERNASAYYSQQACIAARYDKYTIIAENNYFGSGIKKAITPSTDAAGKCYQSGNKFIESGSCTLTTTSDKPFTVSYDYTLDAASALPSSVSTNAGAGKWKVEQ